VTRSPPCLPRCALNATTSCLALDEEGGDVTRLEWDTGSSYPGGAALGAVDDVAVTEAVAASIAADLAAAGVNWKPGAGR